MSSLPLLTGLVPVGTPGAAVDDRGNLYIRADELLGVFEAVLTELRGIHLVLTDLSGQTGEVVSDTEAV